MSPCPVFTPFSLGKGGQQARQTDLILNLPVPPLTLYSYQGCAIIEFLILFDLQYSWGLFCNTNINNDICQGCFAIATSITISERGALQYQFQYNTIRCMFCNSNINTNVSRGCFAISISVATPAWCV